MSNRTTEDLRETLFDCIEQVKAGTLDTKQSREVVNLAKVVLDSARLELDHSQLLSRLDKDGQEVKTGPILLTQMKPAES